MICVTCPVATRALTVIRLRIEKVRTDRRTPAKLERLERDLHIDTVLKEWWKLTDPCQRPHDSLAPGENRANMEAVFFHP